VVSARDGKVSGRLKYLFNLVGRPPKTVSAQKQLSVDEAEDQTGITKLQAHKWRRLKEPDGPTGA